MGPSETCFLHSNDTAIETPGIARNIMIFSPSSKEGKKLFASSHAYLAKGALRRGDLKRKIEAKTFSSSSSYSISFWVATFPLLLTCHRLEAKFLMRNLEILLSAQKSTSVGRAKVAEEV